MLVSRKNNSPASPANGKPFIPNKIFLCLQGFYKYL